jgi:hypothetical protein
VCSSDLVNVGTAIDGSAAKVTPVDADVVPILDSAAANVLKKVTWANVKATLKTYFDTLYATAASIANMVTSAAVIGDTKLVVGSGGARGVAESTLTGSLISAASGVPAAVTVGTGVITAIGVNVGSAGAVVVNGGALGTPSSGVATNLTGLPLTTGVTGLLPIANGGTGTATPALVQGSNITITGSWPNQTIASSGGGGGGSNGLILAVSFTCLPC